MNLKNLRIAFIFALTSFAAVPMSGQDLLARQAPVDKKMKKVDSVALHQLIYQEMLDNPAADLYDEWDTEMTHYHNAATTLPETATIDLRGFCMPTPSRVITSNFGARWGRQHKGLDVKVYVGDTIRAAFSGKVRIVKYEARGYGKYVVIRHYNGLETYYAHMSKQLVHEDQEVKAGDPIGLGGNTGRSTGSHLHFETRLCGVALNPALLFDFRAQDVTGDFYLLSQLPLPFCVVPKPAKSAVSIRNPTMTRRWLSQLPKHPLHPTFTSIRSRKARPFRPSPRNAV